MIAQRGKEAVPEGVVLVHVKGARDAHAAILGLAARQDLAVKEQLLLELKEVGHLGCGVCVARALLTAIARDKATALARGLVAAKVVDGKQALVVALLAAHGGVLDLDEVDLCGAQQRGAIAVCAISCQQGGAVSAHVTCDVGAHGLMTGQILKRAQNGVVEEGATLDNHFVAQLACIAQFDDLEQRVLDYGIAQAGRYIANSGALLLGLLDATIHENGAAAAQIHRGGSMQGFFGKVLDAVAQAAGKGLNKGAASARAGLVEHDVLDYAVFDAQALHVLAANVQDKLHAREHLLGAAQMRHGLDLSTIGLDGLKQKALAIAGDGRVP